MAQRTSPSLPSRSLPLHPLRTLPGVVLPVVLALCLVAVAAGCGGPTEEGDVPSETTAPAVDVATTESVEDAAATSAEDVAAEPWFVDSTTVWGVNFRHASGAAGELRFPEMMGGGVAVFDPDGDGDLDLYFVSGAMDVGRGARDAGADSGPVNEYWEQRDGVFVDATAFSGLGDPGYGTGVAVGDFDNDGHEDVYVANIGPDRLFRGRGDGTFEDVTEQAGVEVGKWSTSVAFCDLDHDDWLDLYVVRYVVWDPEVECTDKAGRREYCGPASFPDETDVLLYNNGDGTFRDATAEAGIDAITGAGLGVICQDLDDDGLMDVYVANDGDPNQLWINQGDGTFVDDALIMGTSVNAAGLFEAGMGVVAADFDGDADFDLFVTHLRDETNTFYRNLGSGIGFEDQSTRVGLATESTPYTGFGTAPFDADLDGDLDLVIVNGRVTRGDPLTDSLDEPWNLYAEPNLVYAFEDGVFHLLGDEVRAFTGMIEVSRGLATGDLDGDGDLDVAVTNVEGPARLYRNVVPTDGHWLLVDAVDPRLGSSGNDVSGRGRRALGARITVESAAGAQVRTLQGAMSYLSASDPRAHFGFPPEVTETEAIRVRWPDGRMETFPGGAVNRSVVVVRGEGREDGS